MEEKWIALKDNRDRPWVIEGWKPKCKADVVNVLLDVQVGLISCRKASDILFPEFTTP